MGFIHTQGSLTHAHTRLSLYEHHRSIILPTATKSLTSDSVSNG
jgi:hypothetical protein